MIEYGMPNLVECKDIDECALLCHRLGLQFIEINQSFPKYQPTDMDVSHLLELKNRYGIGYSIHMDEAMNPLDFNDKVAEVYRNNAVESIEFAKALGITKLNLHLLRGIYVTLPEKRIFLNDVYENEYLDKVRLFRSTCERAIGESGIKICIENTDDPFIPCHRKAIPLLLESPVFGLTLDTGHDHASNHADLDFFQSNQQRLCHVHLHNCRGKSPHLPLDDGDVDIEGMLNLVKKTGADCVIEVKTVAGLEQSVEWLKQRRSITEYNVL
ncbi:MAG: sugar phosphate isomerase/epimerase [Clostridia bacterium]|nr:sugar phosphate isomerase/epimerase [Clostridia bacterium]